MDRGEEDARSDEASGSLTPHTHSGSGWASTTGRSLDPPREAGSRVGPYIVLDQLGVGGMGVVYAAYDGKLDRKIALKVLRSEGHDESAAVGRLRLVSEGRALARVAHPNVVTVFDVGTVDEEVYVAMELVDGQTLGTWRAETPRPWPEVVEMFADIAKGLSAVHDAGLVHRDVKPDNILIDGDGRPRVTDFGLARAEADVSESSRRHPALEEGDTPLENPRLTQTGARLGTPAYMASEQLKGQPATPRSDQFAFCVALWEALYGERPFKGGSWVSLVMAVSEGQIREPPSPPSGRPVPLWLRHVVERGLSADPELRWPSMLALGEALRAGDPHRARRHATMAASGLGLMAMLGGGVLWQQHQDRARAEADCTHASQAVHDVWSEQRRAQLQDTFAASSIDDALGIHASVTAVLDTFVGAWVDERAAVCLATLDAPQDAVLQQRAECLDTRIETLDTLLDTFVRGGDVVVSRARRSAEGLTDLGRCSDVERLARMPPPPSDPDVRAQVREADRSLRQTLVHEHVGHYDEGLRRSRAALEQARSTEHAPLIARALYRVAVFEEKLGNYEPAVEHWVASYREATLCGDEDLAAQAAGALAFSEGYQLGRHDTGIRWSQQAGILLERLDKTQTLDEARRLDVLAVLTEMKGDLDGSVTLHERSIGLRESLVPDTHQSIGYGLANLAAVLQQQGRLSEAEQALLRARAIFENAFGADNPTTAHVLSNLAGLYDEQKRFAEGHALHTEVLGIWTSLLGPDHPDVGDVYAAMADASRAQGQLDDAMQHDRAAIRVYSGPRGDGQDVRLATRRWSLGRTLVLQGRADEGRQQLQEALEDVRGHDASRLEGKILLALGWQSLDRPETARANFERAQGLFESEAEPSQAWRARSRIALAALDTPARAQPQWRAVVDDDTLPDSVRAEALARSLRRATDPPPEDRALLETLLASCLPEDTSRVRQVLEPSALSLR
jgi:tetratricopeptide (TPR) repeat protein